MLFEHNLYSTLLLVFFALGIILCLALFTKATLRKSAPEKWLALFILLCCLYIAPWMLGFAGWYDNVYYRTIIFYTTFHHLFFIGPIIYFYVQSLLNGQFQIGKKNIIHLVPGLLYLCYAIFTWLYDCYIADSPYFYKRGADREFDAWYQIAGFVSMVCYFIFSIRYYNLYKKLIVNTVSYADKILFNWLRSFLIAFLVLLIIKGIFQVLALMLPTDVFNYKESWWQYFFFGVVYCYIGFMGFQNLIVPKQNFEADVLKDTVNVITEGKQEELELISNFQTTADPNINDWKNRIEHYMTEQKAFQNEELTLSQMAKDLNTNQNQISKTINQGYGVNFNDFVNKYRIEAVKEAIRNQEHQNQTLLSIAYDCGFNSKATFNRAFKKHTNFSPMEWITSTK